MRGVVGATVLLLLSIGVRGDAGCTNGAVDTAVGDAGSTCSCNAGYVGGGAVANGGTAGATYPDCIACGAGQYQDETGQNGCKS